jgi:hypothetical protein
MPAQAQNPYLKNRRRTYTVKRGNTWATISKALGTSVQRGSGPTISGT